MKDRTACARNFQCQVELKQKKVPVFNVCHVSMVNGDRRLWKLKKFQLIHSIIPVILENFFINYKRQVCQILSLKVA